MFLETILLNDEINNSCINAKKHNMVSSSQS